MDTERAVAFVKHLYDLTLEYEDELLYDQLYEMVKTYIPIMPFISEFDNLNLSAGELRSSLEFLEEHDCSALEVDRYIRHSRFKSNPMGDIRIIKCGECEKEHDITEYELW